MSMIVLVAAGEGLAIGTRLKRALEMPMRNDVGTMPDRDAEP